MPFTSFVEYAILFYLFFSPAKNKDKKKKTFVYFYFMFKRVNACKVTTVPGIRKHTKNDSY